MKLTALSIFAAAIAVASQAIGSPAPQTSSITYKCTSSHLRLGRLAYSKLLQALVPLTITLNVPSDIDAAVHISTGLEHVMPERLDYAP
ncbi:hypothetical protein CPB84DRAFT_189957 [Gymnopilus junonius]|uniref:Uncharacterized protein n=1 Tax=Gymnopilus junonius TaxID=109634 RepID=A0A9P5NH94_GYMJU|nr:hypothetical protein CPB84DRAFT_189957 [Gymnopilus junonius]